MTLKVPAVPKVTRMLPLEVAWAHTATAPAALPSQVSACTVL